MSISSLNMLQNHFLLCIFGITVIWCLYPLQQIDVSFYIVIITMQNATAQLHFFRVHGIHLVISTLSQLDYRVKLHQASTTALAHLIWCFSALLQAMEGENSLSNECCYAVCPMWHTAGFPTISTPQWNKSRQGGKDETCKQLFQLHWMHVAKDEKNCVSFTGDHKSWLGFLFTLFILAFGP